MTLLDSVRDDLQGIPADDLVPTLRRGQVSDVDQVVEVTPLAEGSAVAALRLVDGRDLFIPIVHDGHWRRAEPADAISVAAFDAPPPLRVEHVNAFPTLDAGHERGLDVDMTNDVRIVDDAVAIKWHFQRMPGSQIGPRVTAHLSAAGFTEIPQPLANLSWSDDLVATADRFLPDAEDGWDWMLDDVRRMLMSEAPAPTWAGEIGRLTARMHGASARPTRVIEEPVTHAPLADLAPHYRSLIDEPLDPQMHGAVQRWRNRFLEACEVLAHARHAEVMPIHRDLHPGQFLRWREGIAICDFDGSPTIPAEMHHLRGPTALDVAGVLRGLDHVAIAAARRVDDPVALDRARAWAAEARAEALTAYRGMPDVPPLDEDVLGALESLSPLHEAVYAARYLPRWRYVPLAVLDGGW